jgi:GNAT superfamily N-acetyltransferase
MRSTGVRVRELTADDLPDALALSTSAGWNQQTEDWRMLRTLAASGAFAAEIDGRVVGTALAIDYGRFAWIAMMLVEPAARGKGVGTQLLTAALAAVPSDRVVRLDATPAGRPLYRRFGFDDESTLTRFVTPRAVVPASSGLPQTRSMAAADLPLVSRHDLESFGGNRTDVIAWALHRAPQYALMLDGADGPPQYVFGRPGRLFDQIGPVIAADDRHARALVTAALAPAAGHSVVIDAFDMAGEFSRWLRACGFIGERPLYRMRRSPAAMTSAAGADAQSFPQFAICGPDFA